MEVEMKIRGLMVDPVSNTPIVLLKDVTGEGVLPIWVGVFEANAIRLEIENEEHKSFVEQEVYRLMARGGVNLFLPCLLRGDRNELITRAQIECLSFPGVCCCVHSRPDRCPSRDVCQPQNVTIPRLLGFMNCPVGHGSQ